MKLVMKRERIGRRKGYEVLSNKKIMKNKKKPINHIQPKILLDFAVIV